MEKYKSMLVEAIKNSDIIPPKQKGTLEVLCLSEYPLTASAIEKKLHSTTQRVHFSLKSLLKRNFIIREKDGRYVYRPNYTRIEELIKRQKI
jgi:predicted transcriptional regulator